MKTSDTSIVDQVMAESSQPADQNSAMLLQSLKQQVMQLMKQQGEAQAGAEEGAVSGQPAQG